MAESSKLILNDLGLLLDELVNVGMKWYHLGVHLKVSVGTLDRIKAQFPDPRDQLLEMLKTWLTTSDSTSWKMLIDALRGRGVEEFKLAGVLEAKYCRMKETKVYETAQTPPDITDPSQVDSTPLGSKLTLNDLGLLLDELLDMCMNWYRIGLHLRVRTGTLDKIRTQFTDPGDQLLEMLKTWLTTGDNTSWKTLIDALNSPSVGAYQLADDLMRKQMEETEVDIHKTAQSPPDITDPSQVDSTPLGSKLTLDDLHLLQDKLLDVCIRWYPLGLHLSMRIGILDRIQMQFSAADDRLREMLKTWLTTCDNPSWKVLINALRSRSVGAYQLADDLMRKWMEETEVRIHKTAQSPPDITDPSQVDSTPLGVPQISQVPVTTQDEDKSGPPSVSNYPSPPPTLQPAVAHGGTSSSPHLLPHLGAAPQLIQGQFGYRRVQLLKTEPLGTGSYGAVYKARCDDLPCAGKILHSTLFQSNDPGAMTVMSRFQQECSVLSAIRHPNIIQYLGSYQDPETRLPVLLMELMDESLTRFLEPSQEPLPYNTQVNISHDIALALAYLHSHDIIHRDLSSNNVLLIGAGNRAKITDFGMAKFFDANRSTMTPQTMCPGTLAYMSPEALDDPPVYTKKLDTFSFGVLGIQIVTRQFPDPGPRTKKVQDPRDPKRRLQEVVPEIERRKSHIDLIDPTHSLLPITMSCLRYNEEDRPSAQEVCHHLAALKEAPQYGDSVQQAQERSRAVHRETQIKEQQQQKKFREQIQVLQQQLQAQVQEKDAALAVRQQEYEAVAQEKDQIIETKETQLQELKQKLAASEQVTTQLQKTIQELQEENQRKLGKFPMVTQKGSIHGVEVAGEDEFTVSTEGGTFQWKGYGLRLHVSKDSLPPGTTECRINIKVSLSGQFQLPEGSDLLSPVFWITAPCKFTKPVTLEIQHCALMEDEAVLSNLSFVLTKCSQKDLPYRFRQVDGGVFTKHSAYGTIQLKHFSGFSTAGSEETPRSYCAHLYHTMENVHDWIFYFVITQDLDAENTVVREHYRHCTQKATLRVSFESSEITLNIPVPEGLVTGEGWRITPFTAPTITKKDVDQFKKGRWIPECRLVVQWEREDQRPVRLRQKVDLTGAKAPYNFINLILNPTGQGAEPLLSPRTQSSGGKPTMPELLKFTCADNKTINVTKEIGDEYRCFGIFLLQDLNGQKVKSIKSKHHSDPSQINTEILEEWLAGKGKKPVTWATLVQVLRDTELYSLADVISAVKCPNSEQ